METTDRNNTIESILKGSFDLDVKTRPNTQSLMRMDGIDTAKYAFEFEMHGFALNSSEYLTTPSAQMLNRMYPGINIEGSIPLNFPVKEGVAKDTENAANIGAKIARLQKNPSANSINDLIELEKFISTIKNHSMLLICENLSVEESKSILNLAKNVGIDKFMTYHPMQSTSIDDLKHMASLGGYIELAFNDLMPLSANITIETMCKTIKEIGADYCVATTRFGDIELPPPAEGMRMFIACLLETGLSVNDVSKLVKINPNKLIS
tara:strand:- start:929 stop:1723 length:795 start_codon:yes stop_codon:yes gene_type:complete